MWEACRSATTLGSVAWRAGLKCISCNDLSPASEQVSVLECALCMRDRRRGRSCVLASGISNFPALADCT